MTSEIVRGSPSAPLDRPATSPAVRWVLGLFLVALVLLALAIFTGAVIAFRWWIEDRVAAIAVEQEAARVRDAGQPMTVSDLYALHTAPPDSADSTAAWQAALQAVSGSLTHDAIGLPYLSDGDRALLRPTAADSLLAAVEAFLAKYDSAVQATLVAAREPGVCRFPVKFEQGFSGLPPEVQAVRTLLRLLALDVHVKAVRGQAAAALESLVAMFAASDALSHQLTIVEQQVRLATLGAALGQVELVLNEVELTDDQLVRLAQRLEGCDLQGSFTRSLIGERAMGYQAFNQLPTISHSVDCHKYLELLSQAITFSSQPLPAGRNQMQLVTAQFTAAEAAAPAWSKDKHALSAPLLPTLTSSFDAYAVAIAYRETLLTAIAAERYRLKTGRLPTQLADLTPDYLAATPLDPFDDQPLRFLVRDGELLIYSVGLNGKDDGAANPPGNSREPDIVVRLSAAKGR
jgi:hypothetical protein